MPGSELSGSAAEISLISAVRFGDESAMARLYDRYSAIVYAVALRVLVDATAAEFFRSSLCSYGETPDCSIRVTETWQAGWQLLRAIARSTLYANVVLKPNIADLVVSVEPDLAGEAEHARAMEKVRHTLGPMPTAQRSALEMAYFEGLTHRNRIQGWRTSGNG